MLHLFGPISNSNASDGVGTGLFPVLIAIISLKLDGVGITNEDTLSIKLCLSNFKRSLLFSLFLPRSKI